MGNHVIETKDLTVYYGKHRGILNVNLTVEKGEVFGFLGPNGAGKTTTQRVLLDVFPPSAGNASIFGLDCQKQGVELRKRAQMGIGASWQTGLTWIQTARSGISREGINKR